MGNVDIVMLRTPSGDGPPRRRFNPFQPACRVSKRSFEAET